MRNQTKKKMGFCLPLFVIFLMYSANINAQVDYEQELSGKEYDIGFLLTWSTSDESNNQVFIVERSSDGQPFENIGSVVSKGEGDLNTYEFKDLDLGLKEVTYRLKEVAKDGTSSFSPQLDLKKASVNNFRVVKREKLTNELFQITVNTIMEGEIECRITNNSGDYLLEEIKELKPGLNDYIFDFASEQDGTYNIILKLANELESVVFLKETKDKKGNFANQKDGKKGG